MPIFENKGVKYDVSPEYIPDFASEYPDAVIVIERPDKPYRVKASQYNIFMQQHPEPDISIDEMRDTDNFFGDFGERLAAGAGRLVGSSTNLLKKITTPVESAVDWANEHTKGAAGAAAQSLAGTIPGLGMIAHIPDKNAGLERLSKNAEAFAEDMHERSDRYKGKSFSDLWSEGDYQGAFGSAFLDAAESAATSAAIAATGGAGLVAAGLTTASDKYDELSRENPEMGETLKWANAIGTGAAESLSEVFGAGMMGRTVKNILQKSGREAAANLVKKNFLDKIASFEGKHWFAMPIASEGLEEAGNALAGYAIDRLTGVERNDNIFKTMLDAGVAGSMGGAQFSPFIGAAKGYSAYQKRQITNRYKESSTFAGEILHGDVEKFNDAIVNRLKNPKSIQSFIDNVASVKNLNPEEKRKLEQYTVDLLNYNGYVDYVQSRIDEETRRRMDDVGRTANKDMGQVVTVKFPSSDQPVYITGGNIVFDEEGLVDAKQSDDILYYLDENGKVQQGRPEMFDSLIEQYPVEQLYADIINTVPGEVIAQEEMESEAADIQPVMFNPGDLVNLVDGRQGIVQQMSDDGGVIVEVDGMTEEIGLDSVIDNMSKNQTQNEDSSTDGDSKVLENVPEKTLESVVASLPKRNDGTIDYKAMTPQQQYEYTSLSESPQTALEDLRADIENKRSEVSKSESRIEKASGGERASLRDEIRVKKQELADLEAFYRTVTPDVDSSAEENVILPASQTEIPINQESNTPESSIPMDEAGNPIYHQAEISDTLDALLDGSLTLEEVDQFVNNHISDAERRLTESGKKAPVMELDIEGYKARKKEWEEGRKPIEQEKSYWEDIKSKLQDARVKPGEEAAINLMRNTAPQSGEELAAQMLANGSIKLLQDDYRRETGGRISESRSLFGLFAGKDKGGVSIERAGEILMQADLENGSNFFDQNDPNAGRNAIIEVLSTARTRGDLINYIKNRREAKAEEIRQAEYNEYARWCEENYHLSPEDYEAYEDAVVRDFKEKLLTDEEQFELDSQMADEIQAIQEELEEIDAILAQNRTEKDENTEGNDESGGDVLREGGSEILQGEQSAQTGRSGEIEAGEPAGPGVDRANGVAQESAPGEIKPIGKGVFGDIYDQFRGKAKEAIKFLLRKRSGEAIGALHHKEVGDIDLVWGKEGTGKSNGFGLSKLAKFHPEVLDSLQDILDDMVVISRSANRVNLESKTHKAAVRLEWDGEKKNWLLTAFEKEKPTATDRTTDIGDTELQNDTAPLQTESSSTDKDSDSSRNTNDLSEKIADAEANRADGAAQESASGEIDRQGNPIDSEGNLIIEDVSSVSDITDEDFTSPYRTIGLPVVPKNVSDAIGADGKRVIIKKNIFEKNGKAHAFTPQSSRDILERALYNPDIVGQSQPNTKKNHWIVIKLDDKSPIVVLEVNSNKDNVEIVGWYTLDNRNLDRIKRQAKREGGELLILTSKEAAASLSTLPSDLSSTDKDSDSSRNTNDLSEKIADAEANRADGAAQEGAGDEAVGRRYADEAQQGPVPKLQGLSGEEADLLLSRMESAAEISSEKELTPETWAETFDENNFIATPIGSVKMGGNQITKFFEKKRTKEFGMVGPTLSNPDVIIGEASEAKDGNAERGSSFLFIKTFNRNGEKVKFYASITVKQDGMEVSVSSHYMNKNKVKRALQESSVLYIREALLSNSSEWRLAEHRDDVPDLLPTQESNASKNKDTHSFRNNSELSEKIADAEANTDINPTEAQKEAGNYKKGHVRVGTFDISIEQPKGSVRSGVDANGKKWETTMQNTYGYIRGTEGVDGDHIDVFLSDDIDGWNGRKAFVVDQYNEDGSFDEHKVMLGFNEAADAETAYFANYDKDWAKKHKTVVTPVNLEDFEKWIGSSHRKTKAFAEYKSVKTDSNKAQQELDKREAENNDNLRFRTAKESDVSSFAQKHQLEEADVKKYAESMKAGNLGGASYAFKSIKRSIRLANDQLSLGEFVKVFSPVKAELFDKFGNVDELRDSYVKQAQDERNAMEAARKREEEAAAAERKRLEEFELMSSEALDRAYLEAVEAQDESRMRDLVNEAARRKGYLSTDEFRMAHRAPSYDEEGIDKSMVDVAQNKDNIRDSLDEQFRMNRDKNREESIAAISEALDAIDKGEKPMVTIYRAVPKSLKEGSVRNGDWVTLSEAYARQHGNHALEGDYRMMEERVPAENLYWDGNDINEWGYDDKSDYLYKDTRNNRKLNDLVTRDDKGNIIPLSQRFNARKSDPRFRFIGEQGAARLDAAEEATTRLDNLNVAREMESAFNEKKQRIEKLRKSEPVEITGWEIEPSDDLKQYKKNALEYGKRLRGEYTNKDTGETVMVGKNAIKEVLNHDYKNAEQLQSVAAIPQIIENAVYIESQANTDDKVDAEKFDYYVCGMKIGGEDYTVRAVIVTPKEGTRYYDHKLSKIEKGKLLDSLIGITTPGFNQTTSLNSDIKDTKLLSLLQINEKENARKIKLATGWERGADGKWRYEVPDFEVDPKGLARKDRLWANLPWGKDFDNLNGRLLDGEELSEEELARYDELSERAEAMRSSYRSEEVRYLDDYVKDPRLFEAYPELRQMRVELYKDGSSRTGATFYEAQNLIRVNEAALETEDLRSLIAHEVQHAIQASEGFARGGNESTYKKHLNTLKEKRDAWSMVDEFKEKQKELGDEARQIDVYNALVDEYHSLGMTFGDGFVPSREAFDKGFNLWARGYDNEGYEDAYNEYQSLTEKYGLGESRNRYKELSGEVEARNVQRRLSMTPEERRRTLAEETEDVAREDQLFLDDALGKPASYAPASGNIEEVNERFNEDLQRQIDGSLPKGHVYKLGNPSRFLQAAGFPYLPIELRADKLATKASEKYKSNHPFNLTSVENLPQAIANPIAVFDSKTRIDAKVVLTELESNGDNFVVAIQVNRKVGNIEINSVRSIYPKDYVKDIYSWINDGLLKWVDKKKATDFISNSSTPANVDDKNSSFSSATKIVESFVNPTLDEGKISSAVDELASGLHIPIHIIRDVNDITDDDKDTQRKKRGSKGWYDMETGEVYLVLPNAESIADAQATILHEVVAHKGLRGLLGEKFDDMMDSVYRNLPEDVRRKVTCAGLSRYGGDFRIATEEYLASVAENGVSEPSIWQKIKSAIRGFFRSLGIDLRMRDEDIAYMLWKSKNRLEKGDSLVTIIHKVAKDGNMRDTLLFRDPLVSSGTMLATSAEERRSMVRAIRSVIEGLKSASPSSWKFYQRFRESYQDMMIPLRDFQRDLEKEMGRKVKDYENAYIFENTSKGKGEYDMDKFKETEFKALVDEVARLSKKDGVIDPEKRERVELYMKAKHGLERNMKMREEAIAALETPSEEAIEAIRNKDYAGLTAVTKKLDPEKSGMDEILVGEFVRKFEEENNTDPLWKCVREATHASLEKMYRSNLISREARDKIAGMYQYYVPLKEWSEQTAGDIWDYMDADRDAVSNPLQTAKGRTSMAGDVLANIIHDYESATIMGYKNLTKLRFVNLVRNSKTGKASVSGQWYVKSGVDAEGQTLWEPVTAEGLTEDVEANAAIINDFEEKMKSLQKEGEAKTQKEVLSLGVPIKDWQEKQHVVRVKEGGKNLVIYINGDPRVAQAINGLNNRNLDNEVLRWMNKIRQFMMLNYTSRNINFIFRNVGRDFFYTNTMNYVKYGAGFEARYIVNYFNAVRRIAGVVIRGKHDADYDAFLRGGGRTGYVEVMGYDKYKREVGRMVRKSAGGKLQVKDVLNVFGGWLETVNGVAENASRFGTYLTAKQVGMSELQSIQAAKEASVNFNRRGSGAMGAAYAQNFYFFFNAAIQGSHNFLSAGVANPKRMAAAIAFWTTLGYALSLASRMLLGDDDEYNEIPDYVRQNNVILPFDMDGTYALLPLPVELRVLYGLGDMAAQYQHGEYKGRDFAGDVVGKLMELFPLDVEGSSSDNAVESALKAFTPDAISPLLDTYWFNENFYGKRITGRNEFNKYVPEYHKVTTGTSKAIIKASERLNSLSGGDYASKGKLDYALLNPSAVEYLFEQYLGGVGKAIAQCYKTVEGAVTGDVQLRNIPVVSGLTYDTENMVPRNYTNERYNHYVKEYEEMQSRDRMYRKGLEGGKDLSGNYKSFANSRAYRRYQTTGFYKKAIESMYDMARLMDGEEKKALYEQARKTKEMMINELDKIGDE